MAPESIYLSNLINEQGRIFRLLQEKLKVHTAEKTPPKHSEPSYLLGSSKYAMLYLQDLYFLPEVVFCNTNLRGKKTLVVEFFTDGYEIKL